MRHTIESQLGGGRAVATQQHGKGPTLLLLHGAGGNHHSYDPILDHLSHASYLVPALPGRCGSEGEAPSSAAHAARWLAEFVERLDLGPTLVCGHSYGGALAIELALLASPAIDLRGLALLSTGARLRVSPLILQLMEQSAVTSTPVPLSAVAMRRGLDSGLLARVEQAQRLTPPSSTLNDWRAADAFDRMGDVSSIELPTLVIVGEDDVLTPPKYARYLAEHIPKAELETLPGAGHMLLVEEPEASARLLAAFATRLE